MERLRIDMPANRIASFCKKWKAKEFALFGSILGDAFRPDSDVDVLVELQPDHGLTLFDWVDMIDELKAIFGRDVDLVAKGGLKPLSSQRNLEDCKGDLCGLRRAI